MAANMQKIKLLKLYALLRKETDKGHPISRVELCRRLNEMGISSNVRTLSLDIAVMQENGRAGREGRRPRRITPSRADKREYGLLQYAEAYQRSHPLHRR